jgi:SAM-dependent methyltransferase
MITGMSTAKESTPDFEAIKIRQRTMWGSGDYASIASMIHYMSERIAEDVDLSAGQTVLDVATGSGNAAIATARRGACVTGTDYVQSLLDAAQRRSDAESLDVTWQLADAESLPFDDNSFDVVTSVVGVMFAPNQAKAACELARVCKAGGQIAVANWTPEGFIGALLTTVKAFVPPPPGIFPPVRWGTRDGIRELLGGKAELGFAESDLVFRFRTADDFARTFIEKYGPTERAHASLDADGQVAFSRALADLAAEWNRSNDSTIKIPSTYLVTTARRKEA